MQSNSIKATWLLKVVSIVTLVVCLFYAAAQAFTPPTMALTVNASWEVIDIDECNAGPIICESNNAAVQPDDRLLKVGDLTYEEYIADRNRYLFSDFVPGDMVPILRDRAGQIQEVFWQMPETEPANRIMYLVTASMVFSPFWLVGTAVLFFMQPRNSRWRLLVLFNYLIAIWLVAGLGGVDHLVAGSTLVVHAISWLMLPVFIHLHLEMPGRIMPRFIHYGLPFIYASALLMAGAELIQALPSNLYLVSVSIAILGSLVVLVYRFIWRRSPPERLATRLMLLGILFGFGPGIVLAILPFALGSGAPGSYGINVTLLAIPSLPLFYGYAVYKRYLGLHESAINRALSYYTQFLLFLTAIIIITTIGRRFTPSTTETVRLVIIAASLFVLVALLLQERIQRVGLRLAYGIEYERDKLFQVFAGYIPAVTSREELADLITHQLMPEMGITQSALVTFEDSGLTVLYRQRVELTSLPLQSEAFKKLSTSASRYSPVPPQVRPPEADEYSWVRLAIVLEAQTTTIGIWLFGSRKPDDFYSRQEIELLTMLGKQIAVTIERDRLFESVQLQLAERQRAEQALQHYARRIELLHQIDQAILAADSPNSIATAVVDGIFSLLPCVRSSVLLFDSDEGQPTILAQRTNTSAMPAPEQLQPASLSAATLALKRGQIRVIPDLGEMAESIDLARQLYNSGIQSILIIPLCSGDDVIGSFNIGSDLLDAFDTNHINIAREVTSSLEVALHNNRLLTKVRDHGTELHQLSTMLIDIQETERKRISAELHDEVGQVLTAINFNLVAMEQSLKNGSISKFNNRLADTKSLIEQVTEHTRSMSHQLRPAMLQDLGLVPTLRRFVSDFISHRKIAAELHTSNMDERLPDDIETAIYRIVQEAMTNVSRHAKADRVVVSIDQHDHIVRTVIEDNGQGFTHSPSHGESTTVQGIGLIAIRERVTSLDGRFTIHTSRGEGTRLTIEIPLEDKP